MIALWISVHNIVEVVVILEQGLWLKEQTSFAGITEEGSGRYG